MYSAKTITSRLSFIYSHTSLMGKDSIFIMRRFIMIFLTLTDVKLPRLGLTCAGGYDEIPFQARICQKQSPPRRG